jgi:carbonyl reductase 1
MRWWLRLRQRSGVDTKPTRAATGKARETRFRRRSIPPTRRRRSTGPGGRFGGSVTNAVPSSIVSARMRAFAETVSSRGPRGSRSGLPASTGSRRSGRGRADPRAQARRGDLRDGTVVAAVCPGLIATDASRPWFDDTSAAQSPLEAAVPVLRLALDPVDQRLHRELVQFGRVFPW